MFDYLDPAAHPAELVAGLDRAPGPGLLTAALALRPEELPVPELSRYLAGEERLSRCVQAPAMRAVAEIDRRLETPFGSAAEVNRNEANPLTCQKSARDDEQLRVS